MPSLLQELGQALKLASSLLGLSNGSDSRRRPEETAILEALQRFNQSTLDEANASTLDAEHPMFEAWRTSVAAGHTLLGLQGWIDQEAEAGIKSIFIQENAQKAPAGISP